MYTIIMDRTKNLITTEKTYLYQRENLVDKIQFLLPQKYSDLDISSCTIVLKYVDAANIPHAEILQKDVELYKNKLRYTLPIDTALTRYAGDIYFNLTCTKVDMDTQKQYVLHTGETTLSILPIQDYYAFVPDESLDFVDQLVGSLEANIEAMAKVADIYDQEKADNITYEDNKIQLTSDGRKIGNSITIATDESGNPGIVNTEFEVVEF